MTPPRQEPAPGDAVAWLRGVSHRYGAATALDDVTIAIPAGSMAAVVGPDGVGKSTLLSIMAGVRRIQSGTASALGGDLRSADHRRAIVERVAHMPQGLGRNLYPTLTVFENLDFFGRLFGQDREERRARIDDLLRSTGLDPFPDRPAGKLSGGMKQKLSLCCALIHDPDLLILDEPTTGVDPLSRRQFWELIDRIRARRPQMSVIAATAYMDEANRFDWLAAMDAGRIVMTGSPEEVRAKAGAPDLEAAFVALLPEDRRRGHKPVEIGPRPVSDGPPVIEANGLSKTFGSFRAVDNASFRIEKAEIFGFLGSNGCGKSTTMKMLAGLLPATSGTAMLLGQPVDGTDIAIRRRIGYMSQSFSLYGELTVRQNFDLHAGIFQLPAADRAPRIRELLDRFELSAVADVLPEALPLGMRQRLQLAIAVLHRPEVLILDEPTSGVDPIARDRFWQFLADLSRKDGITIFLSTHFMNEAELCDRISLMHAGRLLAVGTPEALTRERGAASLEEAFVGYLSDAIGTRPSPAEPAVEDAPPVPAPPVPAPPPRKPGAGRFDFWRLWACARREATEIRRDPIRLTFAVLGPILLMIAFGFGINFDVDGVSYAALDQDRTGESRAFLAEFEGSTAFVRRPDIMDSAELDRRMATGELALAIEIPAGFGRDLVAGRRPEAGVWIDGAVPFRAETLRGYVAGLSATYISDLARVAGTPAAGADIGLRFRYNPEFRSANALVPGVIMLMLMLIPAMMTAVAVVREKETGSIANFRATPVTALEFLVGKQLPYVAIAFASFLFLLVEGAVVFGVTVTGSLPTLAAGALLFVMASTAFGVLISSFTRTQLAAIFATPVIAMAPSLNFSGMLTPVASLSAGERLFGLLFPPAWFQQISVGTVSKGLGLAQLWPSHLALLAFALAYIAAARLALPKQER